MVSKTNIFLKIENKVFSKYLNYHNTQCTCDNSLYLRVRTIQCQRICEQNWKFKKSEFFRLVSKWKNLDNTPRKPKNINFNLKQVSKFGCLSEHWYLRKFRMLQALCVIVKLKRKRHITFSLATLSFKRKTIIYLRFFLRKSKWC